MLLKINQEGQMKFQISKQRGNIEILKEGEVATALIIPNFGNYLKAHRTLLVGRLVLSENKGKMKGSKIDINWIARKGSNILSEKENIQYATSIKLFDDGELRSI
ncbi:unnamed protein product (macronuclear) [Paramecium tetraurelia]|uniref:Uncharacterized protein n=1 Tax=Paramecium tetraurelia TaxID=5888 RepID=A0DVI9_PARTE|nr:uncharacterized protein GSPATT00020709001 [Paramecium tetraurelia]CAK87056.1 unnamed protein product [Paramecium tetraurelia]|eukprot:XP_001454453.1 hypothetical protein (macronuclear) [Paramecium tetraurelia strain d4-2]